MFLIFSLIIGFIGYVAIGALVAHFVFKWWDTLPEDTNEGNGFIAVWAFWPPILFLHLILFVGAAIGYSVKGIGWCINRSLKFVFKDKTLFEIAAGTKYSELKEPTARY